MTEPVIKSLEVPCSAEMAFDVFVAQVSDWWPLDGHAVSAASGQAAKAVVIEGKVGGAVYEIMHDDVRAEWGEVLVYESGEQITMTWHPGTNADAPTRVAVTFEDMMEGRARVTMVHSGWEAWGDQADEKREGYSKGWDSVLGEHYVGAF